MTRKSRLLLLLLFTLIPVLTQAQDVSTTSEDELNRANSLNGEMKQLFKVGKFEQALEISEEVLAIRQEVLGIDDKSYAISLNDVVHLNVILGRYTQVEPMAESAIDISKKTWGANHPVHATSINNLGELYRRQGRYASAELLYITLIEFWNRVEGLEHPYFATSLNNLASLYHLQGRYVEAERLMQYAAEITKSADGEISANYAIRLNNLAGLYESQGRYLEADSLMQAAIAICHKILPVDHPDHARNLNNLAHLYDLQGRYVEAEPLYKAAAEIKKKVFGKSHPSFGRGINNLAILYLSQGRYKEAESLMIAAAEVQKEALGKAHPDYARSLSSLGKLFNLQGRYKEAEQFMIDAANIRKTTLGEEHPDYASTLINLAGVYLSQRKILEAEQFLRSATEIRKKSLGETHLDYAETLSYLSIVGIISGTSSPDLVKDQVAKALYILNLPSNVNQNPELQILLRFTRALIHRVEDNYDVAVKNLKNILLILENQRFRIGGNESLRAYFLQDNMPYYETLIWWLIEDMQLQSAFHYQERRRARTFLDQMTTVIIDIRESIPEPYRSELIQRESEARALIGEYNTRITATRGDPSIDPDRKAFLLDSLATELGKARDLFSEVDHDIKNASPLYQSTIAKELNPPSIDELRTSVVPADGFLLSYMISPDSSFLFGIGQKEFWVEPLHVNEDVASLLGVSPGALTDTKLDSLLFGTESPEHYGALNTLRDADSTLRDIDTDALRRQLRSQALGGLFQVLIPEPRREAIMNAENLIVIPDGNLNALPFEVLIIDAEEEAPFYWIDKGPFIRYAPSATVLHTLATREDSITTSGSDQVEFLSLSDPVYDAEEVDEEQYLLSYKRADYNRRGRLLQTPTPHGQRKRCHHECLWRRGR